jgi:nicotinamidase-related amidase
MAPTPLDPQRSAILVYDMTETLVVDGPFLEPWVVDGMPAYARLLNRCRQAGVAILYAVPEHSPAGSEICHAIAPQPGDTVIVHPLPGAFDGTDLEAILRRGQRDTLLVTGMAVDRGCNLAARQAYNRGMQSCVVRGVCYTRDIKESPVGPASKTDIERIHLAALHRVGVHVLTVDEVLAALE